MTAPTAADALHPGHWRRASALLDDWLELAPAEQRARVQALRSTEPEVAALLSRLLGAARHTATGADAQRTTTTAAVAGFGDWLHRALAADDGAAAARAGEQFGHWRLVEKLGEGGMGEVWRATRSDALYEGEAAIKLLRDRGDRTRFEQRFARERQVLARLDHPGIARLLDAGVAATASGDAQPYLVLEYVAGELLPAFVARTQPDVAARVRLAVQIGEAVGTAHAQLIVHRDLKPGNVMVTADGRVKLLDFGIAGLLDDAHGADTSLTGLHGRGLTLDYAAPEQITGEPTGVACDVFSLGVLTFEMLTGARPFGAKGANRKVLEHAVLHHEAPRLSQVGVRSRAESKALRGDLEAVVAKALRKQPADRYPTMAAFVADLQRWLDHRPVSAGRGDRRYRARLWLRRNRLVAVLGVATAVSLTAGLGASLWQTQRLQLEARRTQRVQDFLVSLLQATDISVGSADSRSLRGLLDSGRQRVETELAAEPEMQATLYRVLGKSYFSLSETTIAETLYRKALPGIERRYGRASYEYTSLLLDLADDIYEFGRYDEACRHYAEVDALTPRLPARRVEVAINALNSLSACKAQSGDVRESVALRERALALAMRNERQAGESANGLLSDYGLALLRAGRFADAETQFRRSLAAKSGQKQNLNYAITLNLLSEVLTAQGRYAEAAPYGAEARQVIEHGGGDTLTGAFNLRNEARRRYEEGDAATALALIDAALAVLEARVGANAPNAIQMQGMKAQMLASLGRGDAALQLAAGAEARLGDRSPLIHTRVRLSLAAVQVATGHDEDAVATIAKLLAAEEGRLGSGHPHVGAARAWLGMAQSHLHRPEAARTLAEADAVLAREHVPGHALRQMVRGEQLRLAAAGDRR